MREFVKSSFSLGIALSLLAVKQTRNLFGSDGNERGLAPRSLDAISSTTVDQLGGTLRNTFSALDNLQRGLVEIGFAFIFPPIELPWSGRRNGRRELAADVRNNGHVFRDETAFDVRRATIRRSRTARQDARLPDQTKESLVERRS